jgi:hypothetical protein
LYLAFEPSSSRNLGPNLSAEFGRLRQRLRMTRIASPGRTAPSPAPPQSRQQAA